MRAQFAGWPKQFWARFRDHSLFVSLCAYFAIILGTLYLPVGSKLMLATFAVTVAVFVLAVLARFANGWRLITIAFIQGVLVVAFVRGLEALGVTGLSEIILIQITMPLPLAYAWGIDRDERDLDLLEQPLTQ